MARKIVISVGTLVALGLVAGAFIWIRARNVTPPRADTVSPEPTEFREASAASPPTVARNEKPVPSTKNDSDKNKKTAAAPELPLKSGEVLNYTANVSKLENVATLTLKVAGKGNFLGKNVWHLQASAHTLKPLRMVFELDDQFDSYSDSGTLASLQYEMRLNERGEKVQSIQRMTATGREPASREATQARVVAGTRDPLGFMGFLRTTDWSSTKQVSSPVYDGHKLYDVRAKLVSGEAAVGVPAGDFRASKIEIHVFENGVESKDASFTLYLANDAGRTPVLLEAILPVATAHVELVKDLPVTAESKPNGE